MLKLKRGEVSVSAEGNGTYDSAQKVLSMQRVELFTQLVV